MDVYDSWKNNLAGAHQIMALLSAFHHGQVSQGEANQIMNDWGFDQEAKSQMAVIHARLVAGTLSREELDNAFMLGDVDAPGFNTKAEFLARVT